MTTEYNNRVKEHEKKYGTDLVMYPFKKLQSFESYLEDKFMEDYHGDKEHFEDAFNGWLENFDLAIMMEEAEQWGDLQVRIAQKDLLDSINEETAKLLKKY